MKKIYTILGLITVILAGVYYTTPSARFGAFSDPFLSLQLATSPVNGYILSTDGTNNSWIANSGGSAFTGPINSVVTTNGSGSLQATGTQLTVGNILATSTTATSTFTGPVSISGWNISTSTAITVCKYPDFCQYQVNPNSTSTDVQINLALVKASETKTKVYLRGYGTSSPYIISNIIQLPSNTGLIGDGIDVSVIKADLGYNPSTNCNGGTGRRCMIIQKDNGTIYNNILTGFTLDQNVQNIAGLSSDSTHRAIWIDNANNLMIDSIKTINTINYAVYVSFSNRVWIQNSIVLGGYSNTYNQNDGFHIRNSDNWFITNNYCDTLIGGGTSGDDCYVFVVDSSATQDMTNGIIAQNISAGSGSRGIIGNIDSSFNANNISVLDNVVSSSTNAGMKFYVADNTTGIYKNLIVNDNNLTACGLTGSDGGDCLRFDRDYGTARKVFEVLTVNGNTMKGVKSSSWYGINFIAQANNLTVNGNNMTELTGLGGIRFGSSSNTITNYTANDNQIDVSMGASSAKGIYLYNTKRGVTTGNTIQGHTTGTTDCIYLESTSSLTTSYNDVSHNNCFTFDNGVREVNSGANPDFNQYIGNTFNTVSTPYTLVGGSSAYFGLFGGSFGIGTSSPLSKLEITNNGSAFRVSRGSNSQYLDFTQSSSGSILTSNSDYSNQKPFVFNNTLTGSATTINPLSLAFNWQVQGVSKMFLDGQGRLGVGTSTPAFLLTLASTTQPQLSLSAGAGLGQWVMRNAGGNLYLATTTIDGTATTSISALEISGSGFGTTTLRGLSIKGNATSTSDVGFNILGGCYAIAGTCISGGGGGSGTVSSGLAGQLGYYNSSGTTIVGTSTNPLYVDSIFATSTSGLASATSTFLGGMALGNPPTTSDCPNLFCLKGREGVTYTSGSVSQRDAGMVNIDNNDNAREALEIYQPSDNTISAPSLIRIENNNSSASNQMILLKSNSTQFANTAIWIETATAPAIALEQNIWGGTSPNLGAGQFQIDSQNNLFRIESRNNTDSGFCSDFTLSPNFSTTTSGRITMFPCSNASGSVTEGTGRLNVFGTTTVSSLLNLTSVIGATEGNLFTVKQDGWVGVGTSTPLYPLTISSSTVPQLSLSAGGGLAQWAFRNAGGNFYLSTTTVAGTSTSTLSAMTINSNGYVGIGGNDSPATNLEVIGNIRARRPSTAGQYIEIQSNSSSGMFLTAVSDTSSPKNLIINNSVTGGASAANTVIAFQIDDIEKGRWDSSGFFGIATATPWRTLSVVGTMAVNGLTSSSGTPNSVCINATTKEITENAALTCTVSSKDYKTKMTYLSDSTSFGSLGNTTRLSALETLMKIEPAQFAYKDQPNRLRWGFYAEDLAKVDPKLADGYDKDGHARSIDQNAILAVMVNAIKEIAQAQGIVPIKRSVEENWQWVVMGVLVLWNIGLTRKIYVKKTS